MHRVNSVFSNSFFFELFIPNQSNFILIEVEIIVFRISKTSAFQEETIIVIYLDRGGSINLSILRIFLAIN